MRARQLKPGFFRNGDLAALPHWVRLLFAGLWLLCDRDGRMERRLDRIKRELFAFDAVDIPDGLAQLEAGSFLDAYTVNGIAYLQIRTWHKHQNPHKQEPDSRIPSNDSEGVRSDVGTSSEVAQKLHGSARAKSFKSNSKSKSNNQKQKPREALSLPTWLAPELWARWESYRKRTGPFTEDARALSLRTLGKWHAVGHDPKTVIEQSIERGWTGLFPVRSDNDGFRNTGAGNSGGVAGRVAAHARAAIEREEAREPVGAHGFDLRAPMGDEFRRGRGE